MIVYEAHMVESHPFLESMINFVKRKCLVCKKPIRGFSLTGLLRHSICCMIQDRQKQTQDREIADVLQKKVWRPIPILSDLAEQSTSNAKTAEFDSPSRPFPTQGRALAAVRSSRRRRARKGRSVGQSLPQFTQRQREILVRSFRKHKYPTDEDRDALSNETGLTDIQVKVLFLV